MINGLIVLEGRVLETTGRMGGTTMVRIEQIGAPEASNVPIPWMDLRNGEAILPEEALKGSRVTFREETIPIQPRDGRGRCGYSEKRVITELTFIDGPYAGIKYSSSRLLRF